VNTKFLGLQIGSHLNWQNHTEQKVEHVMLLGRWAYQ